MEVQAGRVGPFDIEMDVFRFLDTDRRDIDSLPFLYSSLEITQSES